MAKWYSSHQHPVSKLQALSSPIGLFLRRMSLAFHNLMFEGLALLWYASCLDYGVTVRSDLYTYLNAVAGESPVTLTSWGYSEEELDAIFAKEAKKLDEDIGICCGSFNPLFLKC